MLGPPPEGAEATDAMIKAPLPTTGQGTWDSRDNALLHPATLVPAALTDVYASPTRRSWYSGFPAYATIIGRYPVIREVW